VNNSNPFHNRYSYSKTRGLFGGVSVEGSVIVERQDANVQAYDSPVTVKLLLGGIVEPPPWAAPLINTLEACTGLPGNKKWVEEAGGGHGYVFSGIGTAAPSQLRKKRKSEPFPPPSWGQSRDSGSYFSTEVDEAGSNFATRFQSGLSPGSRTHARQNFSMSQSQSVPNDLFDASTSKVSAHARSYSSASSFPASVSNLQSLDKPPTYIMTKPELIKPLLPNEGVARAIALYNFQAVEVQIDTQVTHNPTHDIYLIN
jgi:hypothetical protein